MRLNAKETEIISKAAAECFGADVDVRLFGSRADDSKKGGDIDLYIATSETDIAAVMRAELAFLVSVKRRIGDQKIDLVVDYPGRRARPAILDIARRTGIPIRRPT